MRTYKATKRGTILNVSTLLSIPEFKAGDVAKALLTVKNEGSIVAKNVVGSVTIKTPTGSPWFVVSFPRQDIMPYDRGVIIRGKAITSADPLGIYTHSGSITCDNAPAVTISGNAFKVVEAPPSEEIEVEIVRLLPPDRYRARVGEWVDIIPTVRNRSNFAGWADFIIDHYPFPKISIPAGGTKTTKVTAFRRTAPGQITITLCVRSLPNHDHISCATRTIIWE